MRNTNIKTAHWLQNVTYDELRMLYYYEYNWVTYYGRNRFWYFWLKLQSDNRWKTIKNYKIYCQSIIMLYWDIPYFMEHFYTDYKNKMQQCDRLKEYLITAI